MTFPTSTLARLPLAAATPAVRRTQDVAGFSCASSGDLDGWGAAPCREAQLFLSRLCIVAVRSKAASYIRRWDGPRKLDSAPAAETPILIGDDMALKFDKVKPGMVLLDIHSYRMGNTTMRCLGCWNVEVISVDVEKRTALCSWNGNPPTLYREREFKRLLTKPSKAYLAQQERRARTGSWI